MAISAQMVKELRELTGAGVLDCKKALEQFDGDMEAAAEHLRQQGLAAAAKKAEREVAEGLIGSYIHTGARQAAIVEVNCETDFVARTEAFQTLARDLAMQIVASRPLYVRREDIPAEALQEQRDAFAKEAKDSGKPASIVDRIVEGKLEKYYEEVCLLNQPFIKDQDQTVGDLVTASIARLGENIVVSRFARLEIGE